MTTETVYYAPAMGDDNDRDELIVYELENGKVYNQLRSNSQDPSSQSETYDKKLRVLVTVCILLTEMGERLTYYSLVANIILFATGNLGYEETTAALINQFFSGVVFLIPIGGGYLADSYTGRFKTIVTAAGIYIVGIALVLFAAIDFEDWGGDNINEAGKRALFIGGLALIAVGTGGIKANVGPFGAEQLQNMGKGAVQSFFNWFYWVINVGAFIAYAGVSYIQQEVSFAWGYFVPLLSMTLSLFIFVVIKSKYLQTKPKGSLMGTALSICRQGCCKEPPEPNPLLPKGSERKSLARAKKSFGGNHKDHIVDGVGSVVKVIPFCVLVIIYWVVNAQMANTFFVQGARMDIRIGNDVQVPVAALNIFNTIAIIVLIPVVDRFLYPFFIRIGFPLTYLKRMGIGMVFAAMAMFVGGIVEIERKNMMNEPGGMHVQTLADVEYNASSMNIFVQVPQFALIGASEIFTSITSLEFAYNQAPVAMQGLLTGLFLAASGFGNLISGGLLVFIQGVTKSDPWWGTEINDCKMENLLFFIGALMMVNFFVFCIFAHRYSYQDPSTFAEVLDEEEEEETSVLDTPQEIPRETTNLNDSPNKSYTRNLGYVPD